ncbi:hypothetical protein K440DRAFT_625427 [Wilcoxina mikolae CBS 423.85]|nr:hypothetical protein K440DRAFT_625427 [Wilcoxina mikolae CBS 423.85]
MASNNVIPRGDYSPSYSGGEDTVTNTDMEREIPYDHGRNGHSAEMRRLRREVERVTQEAARKDNEATRLTEEISRLSAELSRVPAGTAVEHKIPVEATIGGASLSHLLQLSQAELAMLDHDIRVMRRTVLDAPNTGMAEPVQAYLPKEMREAMSRRGVKYEDGGANNDLLQPWVDVFQKREFSDDVRLVGLRDSRRGVPASIPSGRYDIIVACETLIALSRWRNIH